LKVVQQRPEARWLPSRYRFALAKIIAMIVLQRAPKETAELQRMSFTIDRDQSAAENFTVAMWMYLTSTAFVMAVTPRATWILAPLVTPLLMQLPFYASGVIASAFGSQDNRKLNSLVCMTVQMAAAAHFATAEEPVRYVAWFFLAVVALNVIASAAMWLMRGSVAAMERRCDA
jgi:hypothetical protein